MFDHAIRLQKLCFRSWLTDAMSQFHPARSCIGESAIQKCWHTPQRMAPEVDGDLGGFYWQLGITGIEVSHAAHTVHTRVQANLNLRRDVLEPRTARRSADFAEKPCTPCEERSSPVQYAMVSRGLASASNCVAGPVPIDLGTSAIICKPQGAPRTAVVIRSLAVESWIVNLTLDMLGLPFGRIMVTDSMVASHLALMASAVLLLFSSSRARCTMRPRKRGVLCWEAQTDIIWADGFNQSSLPTR